MARESGAAVTTASIRLRGYYMRASSWNRKTPNLTLALALPPTLT